MSEKVLVKFDAAFNEAFCGKCDSYLVENATTCQCGAIPIWKVPETFLTGMLMFDDTEYNEIMMRPAGTFMMNQIIINNWNQVVGSDDTVFILGGVGNLKYLSKLNGKKYVMLNIHDINHHNIKSEYDLRRIEAFIHSESGFYTVGGDIDTELNIKLCIDHTSLSDNPEIVNIAALGGLQKIGKNFIDVSMDAWGFVPCNMNMIDGVIKNMKSDAYRKYAITGSVYDAVSIISERKDVPNVSADWWD